MEEKDRQEFLAGAKPVTLVLEDGTTVAALPKRFSSGSVGWYFSGRLVLAEVSCQVSMCCTIVGSKPGWVPYSERSVQNGTMPAKAPETPAALFEVQKAPKSVKKPPKQP